MDWCPFWLLDIRPLIDCVQRTDDGEWWRRRWRRRRGCSLPMAYHRMEWMNGWMVVVAVVDDDDDDVDEDDGHVFTQKPPIMI